MNSNPRLAYKSFLVPFRLRSSSAEPRTMPGPIVSSGCSLYVLRIFSRKVTSPPQGMSFPFVLPPFHFDVFLTFLIGTLSYSCLLSRVVELLLSSFWKDQMRSGDFYLCSIWSLPPPRSFSDAFRGFLIHGGAIHDQFAPSKEVLPLYVCPFHALAAFQQRISGRRAYRIFDAPLVFPCMAVASGPEVAETSE